MKRYIFTTFLLAVTVMMTGSCTRKSIVWDNPETVCASEYNITITKVVLAEDTTSVFMSYRIGSDDTFTFSSETYIETDDGKYTIIGSDSLVLDEWNRASNGRKDFVLHFPALPERTKLFDLMEGTSSGDFKFFAVHPADFAIPETAVPKGYQGDGSGCDEWPFMEYGEEPATIHMKALNYKPGMDAKFKLMYFDVKHPAGFEPGEADIVMDDDGCADFTLTPYYPIDVQISFVYPYYPDSWNSFTNVVLAPGKEVTVLVDMLVKTDSVKNSFVGYKGYMAKSDWQRRHDPLVACRPKYPNLRTVSSVAEVAGMRDSILPLLKDWDARHEADDLVLYGSDFIDKRLLYNLVSMHEPLFSGQELRDYIMKVRPDCLFSDRFRIDFDLYWLYGLFEGTDVKGIGPDFCRYWDGITKLHAGEFGTKPVIYDDNLSRMYDEIEAEMKQKFDIGRPENLHMQDEIGDLAPENTLQAILDRFKGKTVVIDMWEAWCGPCRMGHQAMASVKEELKDSNIAFVYLSSPSSPLEDWLDAASEIPGEHFYLSAEQSKYISVECGAGQSVPAYLFYNASGRRTDVVVGWYGVETMREKIVAAMK